MKLKQLFKRVALVVSLIALLTSTVQTTFGYIVAESDTLVNTFIPAPSAVSDLLLDKIVEHPFGDTYAIPDTIAFDFHVDLGTFYAGSVIETSLGDKTADDTGRITLTLKPGQTVSVKGLDEGTTVTVTEVQKDGDGFDVKDGVTTKDFTVAADGSVTISFINVYTPAAAAPIVTVRGEKVLEGRDWADGDTFAFLLEQKIDGDWTEVTTETVTYDPENENFDTFDFTEAIQNIAFDKAGLYEFRLSEALGDLANVDYDKTVNHFNVKVGDADMDGKLEIQNVTAAQNAAVEQTEGVYNVTVTFNNTFVPPVIPDDTTVTVTVNKTVTNTGDESIGPDGFHFVLENADGEKIALTTDKNGKATATLTFTAADIGKTFAYTLREVDDGREGVTYDDGTYALTVTIGQDGDQLTATFTNNGEAADTLTAAFENTYHMEKDPSPPTGDGEHTALWLAVMAVSGTIFATLLLSEKRKEKG